MTQTNKIMTLQRFAELQQASVRQQCNRTVDDLIKPNPVVDDFMRNYKPEPVTLRKLMRLGLRRIGDAWLVLTGKANIEQGF